MSTLHLIAALLVTSASPAPADPDQFPLALHRSMEIDDLDREIQRLHDTVLLKRAQLSASQRLAQKGLVSRGDIEKEASDLRYQEAREAETLSYRALKLYERDVLGQATTPDERKSYSLLLDWVRKQGGISKVEVDYQTYLYKQTQALHQRKAVSRQELEDVEIALNGARASLALSRSREAQVLMELAARNGDRVYDAAEYHRLKTDYLKARVRYFEVTAEAARHRSNVARERSKLGLIPPNELAIFDKGVTDADTSLHAERKALEDHEKSPPQPAGGAAPRRRTS